MSTSTLERPTLRAGAINRVQSSVIGIASTAPAYSLAVTVGLLVATVGDAAPVALAVSAVPVVLVALCFAELNREMPDCGTSYAWTERGLGRRTGPMVGWVTVMACVLVMSNLAQVAALYSFDLLGRDGLADSRAAQAVVGSGFIVLMAWLAYRGIRIAARTQVVLVVLEFAALAWFVVEAFAAAETVSLPSFTASGSWSAAFLAAVFLYWGWDSSFSTNEESDDPRRTPGFGALAANGVLLVTYLLVAWAAVAWAGAEQLAEVEDDDFFMVLAGDLMGTVGGQVLVGAVLVSALASTQTTILPTARTMLSMARNDVLPGRLARISPRFRTPSVATWTFAAASIALYVGLVTTSDAVLADSVAATAVLVSLYYLATALAVLRFPFADGLGARPVRRVVVPAVAATVFGGVLVLAAFDLSTTSLVVVAVVLVAGLLTLGSMKPHVEQPEETRT